MIVSVIVPTKDRPEEILRFFHSLTAQSLLPHELIVVDASEASSLGALLRQSYPEPGFKVKYVHTRRVSLTIQKNLGILLSCGDVVCFFDDDIILEESFIKEIVRVFEEDKEGQIVAVTGQITNAWRVPAYQRWVRRIFYLNGPGPGNFHPSGLSAGFIQVDQPREVESLYGGVSAFRRWLFDEFKFDEHIHEMEDDDFAYRISRKHKVFYQPTARCEHRTRPHNRLSQREFMKVKLLSQAYVFHKNFPQTFRYRWAYWVSLFGHAVVMALGRNWEGLLGVLEGIRCILAGEGIKPRAESDPISSNQYVVETWGP